MMLLFSGLALAERFDVPADYGLEDAVAAAVDGDEIAVAPGEYEVALNYDGKELWVHSTDGPDETILRGNEAGPVVTVAKQAGPATTLEGFTITGGGGTERQWIVGNGRMGGGVYVDRAHLTVRDCVFVDNNTVASGGSGGGGLFVSRSEVWVIDSIFKENLGFYGGGAALVSQGTLWIEDSWFEGNLSRHGGALAALNDSRLLLTGNHFVENQAGMGGAIFAKDSIVVSDGDTIHDNEVWHGGGGMALQGSVVTIRRGEMRRNRAQDDGGHIYAAQDTELTISSTWLDQAQARAGGAVFLRGASSILTGEGLLLSGNSATESGGDFWIGQGRAVLSQLTSLHASVPEENAGAFLIAVSGAEVQLINSILFGGVGSKLVSLVSAEAEALNCLFSDYSGTIGAIAQISSVVGDPLMQSTDLLDVDPSLLDGSPAIDAGTNGSLDKDGTRADLGATGGLSPWSPR